MPQQSTVLDAETLESERRFEQVHPADGDVALIHNYHRSVGTQLSGECMRHRIQNGAQSTGQREFHGSAGQSFGAFLDKSLTLKLFGEANDYVGKGMSGGTIIIRAGKSASKRGDVLAGNTVLYGATSGQLFIAGQAGERFAVRNSGAIAVVEGVGQHGCEYMTGGIAVVLGPVGLNFGSGMTGGLAYVLRREAEHVLNNEFVQSHELEQNEERDLRRLLEMHVAETSSPVALRLLLQSTMLPLVRIQPIHFQGTLEAAWRFLPEAPPVSLADQTSSLLAVPPVTFPHYA